MFWPSPSDPGALTRRREQLRDKLAQRGLVRAAFVSGWARPRNFEHNVYPFRAESHFLYLVGRPLEGAILVVAPGGDCLYVTEPDPVAALWNGPQPGLRELETCLELEVRSLDDLRPTPTAAVLPPQDQETAEWLEALLDRPVTACSGSSLTGMDAVLADIMVALRLRHDEAALRQIEQAVQVTALAHRAGMAATRPGLREAVVRAAMEREMVAAGMVPAYGSIVTTRGEVLHNTQHHRVMGEGDLLLADVGAETPEGWAADVTRTWPVGGRFSPTQRDLYEVVLAAQEAGIAAVRPHVRFLDVHRTVAMALGDGLSALGILRGRPESLYERGAVALFFPHGVGHLLGLDVHDMEDLGDRAGYGPGLERSSHPNERALRLDRVLETNMVVTIEPGFYNSPVLLSDRQQVAPLLDCIDLDRLQRFSDVRGIRIEDDVRVTDVGREVLTADIPKQPEVLEAYLQGELSAP